MEMSRMVVKRLVVSNELDRLAAETQSASPLQKS